MGLRYRYRLLDVEGHKKQQQEERRTSRMLRRLEVQQRLFHLAELPAARLIFWVLSYVGMIALVGFLAWLFKG